MAVTAHALLPQASGHDIPLVMIAGSTLHRALQPVAHL
jgi:hypothetical protein